MKVLTDEDVKFKGAEHYYNLKSYFNRPVINNWYEIIYRSSQSIGYVSALFKRLQPTSVKDAFEKYINSGLNEKNLSLSNRGRDYDELEQMAIQWKTLSKSDRPVVDFYDALILHAVVETFDGNKKEFEVIDALKHFGFDVSQPPGEEDSKLGIDIIAKKGGDTFLIQVKPKLFFFGKKKDLVDDRAKVWNMQALGKAKYGPRSDYRYYIYDKENKGWVMNKDGRCSFKYGELVSHDGTVIANMNELVKNEKQKLY